MIPQVDSLDAAQNWFIEHSSGSLMCVRWDGAMREVQCYPDAEAFYNDPAVSKPDNW